MTYYLEKSPDGKIMKYDIGVAKNYLNEDEMKKLERLTISFLDYAEDMAEEHQIMIMNNWIKEIDELLKFRKKIRNNIIKSKIKIMCL